MVAGKKINCRDRDLYKLFGLTGYIKTIIFSENMPSQINKCYSNALAIIIPYC